MLKLQKWEKEMKSYSSMATTAAGLLLVGALAACGGGGGTDPTVAAPATFSVTGTAATGAPFAGATVTLVDSTGAPFTANAVTAADGSYTITVLLSAKPPFVVQAVSADKTVTMVSVVAEAKDTNTNITPITNLIASRLSPSGDPTKLAAELKANPALFDSAALKIKVAEIVALIKPLMDAAGDSSDPLNGKLVADGTSTADKVLDSLTITITPSSASSVDIVVTAKPKPDDTASPMPISFTGGGTNAPVTVTVTAPSGTPSVPADFALMPAASNCSALHSGTYRSVSPSAKALPDPLHNDTMTIDAATLAIAHFRNGIAGFTETWIANGPCRFSAGKEDIVVSQAGVIFMRFGNGTGFSLSIFFPDQTHTQAELAGNWNALSIENTGTTTPAYTGTALSASIDAAGAITAAKFCQNTTTWDVTVCTDVPNGQLSIKANADAGFDLIDKGTVTGRAFAYRSGGGELMLVELDTDGSLTLFTRQRTNTLTTVGATKSGWNVSLGNQLTSGVITETSNTVVSIDATAGTWLRNQASNATLTNTHPETFSLNTPRNGYNFRAKGTALAADGTTANINEITVLGMRGMGFSPLLVPASQSFLFSVDQP